MSDRIPTAVNIILGDDDGKSYANALAERIRSAAATHDDDFLRLDAAAVYRAITALGSTVEELRAELRVTEQNRRAALIEAGHAADCPVVLGASVDCAPPGSCTPQATEWHCPDCGIDFGELVGMGHLLSCPSRHRKGAP